MYVKSWFFQTTKRMFSCYVRHQSSRISKINYFRISEQTEQTLIMGNYLTTGSYETASPAALLYEKIELKQFLLKELMFCRLARLRFIKIVAKNGYRTTFTLLYGVFDTPFYPSSRINGQNSKVSKISI